MYELKADEVRQFAYPSAKNFKTLLKHAEYLDRVATFFEKLNFLRFPGDFQGIFNFFDE